LADYTGRHDNRDSSLKLLERASRFFDIRWLQNDQAFFRFANGREISVFNVHLGIGEALRDFAKIPG